MYYTSYDEKALALSPSECSLKRIPIWFEKSAYKKELTLYGIVGGQDTCWHSAQQWESTTGMSVPVKILITGTDPYAIILFFTFQIAIYMSTRDCWMLDV